MTVLLCLPANRIQRRGGDIHIERYSGMENETAERWRLLCERAATEQDPDTLLQLTEEITRLLEEKERRLKAHRENSAA